MGWGNYGDLMLITRVVRPRLERSHGAEAPSSRTRHAEPDLLLSIVPSDFDAFEELIQKTVAATREEPDTTILDSTARTAARRSP